jgi:eukaryotic-like serine/threonine-protein kinase
VADVIAGRYALCDPIARGGSGVVWRAYDRRLAKFCAAKVLRRRDAGDLLRFVREQSVRLAHPNVLTPYSWAAEDTHVAIASDLVDGGSLSTLIGDYGALSEGTVAVILDQLLAALEAVHEAGLVHRDVKPANLLLRATGSGQVHVLLGDFGLAITEKDARLTQFGMIVGTPGYVAPELLTGNTAVRGGQDLYSAGRVAAALLCGAEPNSGAGQPDLTAVRDSALRELTEALIAINPVRRPKSAREARDWLHSRVRADPQPRTRGGDPIDVMHQLPPLPPMDDLLDASSVPMSSALTGAVAGTAGDTAVHLPGSSSPGSTAPNTRRSASAHAAPAHPTRRRVLLGAAAAVVVGGGIALGLTLTGPDGGTPSSGVDRNPPVQIVQANSSCSWPDQNNAALTSSGQQLTCRLVGNRYVWATG